MQLTTLLSTTALLTGLTSAVAVPAPATGDCPGNQTRYTSTSAGSVCISRPSDCKATYTLQPDDNCYSIPQKFGNLTASILYYWNPDIGRDCASGNFRAYVPVCINTPWYKFQRPVEQPGGTVQTVKSLPATQQPVPLAVGTLQNCTKYELAGNGYYEYDMKQQNGFTDTQFCQWNKGVNCSAPGGPGVQGHYWYAVAC